MKLSQVYLYAAQKVDLSQHLHNGFVFHPCACGAIDSLTSEQVIDGIGAFATVFKPRNRRMGQTWFGSAYTSFHPEEREAALTSNRQHQDHRVFALLFMCELAKDAKL